MLTFLAILNENGTIAFLGDAAASLGLTADHSYHPVLRRGSYNSNRILHRPPPQWGRNSSSRRRRHRASSDLELTMPNRPGCSRDKPLVAFGCTSAEAR